MTEVSAYAGHTDTLIRTIEDHLGPMIWLLPESPRWVGTGKRERVRQIYGQRGFCASARALDIAALTDALNRCFARMGFERRPVPSECPDGQWCLDTRDDSGADLHLRIGETVSLWLDVSPPGS